MRAKLVNFSIVLWSVPFFCASSLLSAEDSSKENETQEQTLSTIEDSLIEKNKEISEKIDESVIALDLYLAKKSYDDVENKSTLKIHNNFSWEEGKGVKYSPHIGLKLHLPHFQKKWQLQLTTYDEDKSERGINKNRSDTEKTEDNFGTSFGIVEELGRIKTEFRPRLEYNNKFQSSYLLKFSSEADAGFFKVQPELQLFARSDSGTGEYFGLNCSLELDRENGIILINEEQYTDGDNTLSTNHGLRYSHIYSRSLEQEITFMGEASNRDVYHIERYILKTKFLHRLYHNVLHYQLTPFLVFAKQKEFAVSPGLNFSFEIIF